MRGFRKPRAQRAATLLGALVMLSGCVSEDAGYQDVRKVVASRTGHEVRWQHVDGDESARGVRELLAQPLTTESAVKLALLNNADLQAGFEELGIARADLMSALRLPNPVAEGSVRFHKNDGTTLDLSVTEDLSQLLFLPLRNSAARAELEAATLSVATRAMDLVLDVRTAFYAYLADQQALDFRRTVLQALEASAEVATALHDAGNVTDLNFESEQVLEQEARVSFASAKAALATSRERLNALLGLWGDGANWRTEARLDAPAEDVPLASLEAKAVERSLDLDIIRKRFVAAARRANLARAEGWLPELKGGVMAERESDGWSYGPLAELQVPLFYQGQGEVARARAEMRRERQLLGAREVQIRAAARATATKLSAARDRALFIKNVLLPSRERILNATQLQFNGMGVSVFQLLMAKRDQVETAKNYVEALRDYWTAYAEFQQLQSGRLPRGSVFDVNGLELGSPSRRVSDGH